MSDIVRITHPERDRTLTVPANLFPGRLASKGWQLADWQPQPATVPSGVVEPEVSPEALNAQLDEKAELRAELERLGIGYDGRSGLKTLRAQVEAARAVKAAE